MTSTTTSEPWLPDRVPLRICFSTDWHIGTGTGEPGGIDQLVSRDADGLPFVGAKTLTGMLRDRALQVAWALDDGDQESAPWGRWAHWLFGGVDPMGPLTAPSGASLSVRPARWSKPVRAALASRPALLAASTVTHAGVTLDPDTRTSVSRQLRFVEFARTGATLETVADLGCPWPPEAAFLFASAARLTTRVGGKRRRGFGRCTVDVGVDPATLTTWAQWAEHAVPGVPPQPARHQDAAPSESGDRTPVPAPHGAWTEIQLHLTAVTPVLAARSRGGNITESHHHLPGSLLFPAVIGRLGLGSWAVAENHLVVTDGRPMTERGATEPLPRSFFGPKRAEPGGDVVLTNVLAREAPPGGRHHPTWVDAADPATLRAATPSLIANTHSVIERRVQRPTERTGGLFTYLAIESGTRFEARVLLSPEASSALGDRGHERLAGTWRIGRSKKDDYGQVDVTVGRPAPMEGPDHREIEELTIWCRSDLLLLDERLRPDPSISRLVAALDIALGSPELTLVETGAAAAAASARHEGWISAWNRPRTSLPVLAAGTVVRVKANHPVDTAAIHDVEVRGLGHRRAEGFGRVSINDPLLDQGECTLAPAGSLPPPGESPEWSGLELSEPGIAAGIRIIEDAAWRTAVNDAVALVAVDWRKALGFSAEDGVPTRAQLGGLRQAAADAAGTGNLERGLAWVRWVERKQEHAPRTGGWPTRAVASLQSWFTDPQAVFATLGIDDRVATSLSMSPREPAATMKDLHASTVHLLVAALCRAAAKDAHRGGV